MKFLNIVPEGNDKQMILDKVVSILEKAGFESDKIQKAKECLMPSSEPEVKKEEPAVKKEVEVEITTGKVEPKEMLVNALQDFITKLSK